MTSKNPALPEHDMRVRQLCSVDLPAYRELMVLFGREFNEPDTYGGTPPPDDYVRSLLEDPRIVFLVAEQEGRVLGGLVAYELRKFEQARSELYIYDLAVGTGNRRQGIATALIEAVRNIATDRGAWVVFVQADHGDEPAIALYTKLGEREDVLHFDIAVESDKDRAGDGAPTRSSKP